MGERRVGGGEARLDEAASLKALRGAFHVQASKGRPIRLQVPRLLRKRKERSHLTESRAIQCRLSVQEGETYWYARPRNSQ